ncbi:MAG: SemiSWEET family sugar transporter [Alphaproteobacteria bacterium]
MISIFSDTHAFALVAAFLCTVSFIPQIHQSLRHRCLKDISSAFLFLYGGGVTSWLLFGFVISNAPLIVASLIQASFVVALILLKFNYRDKEIERGIESVGVGVN